jgi:hypothetical protein
VRASFKPSPAIATRSRKSGDSGGGYRSWAAILDFLRRKLDR